MCRLVYSLLPTVCTVTILSYIKNTFKFNLKQKSIVLNASNKFRHHNIMLDILLEIYQQLQK